MSTSLNYAEKIVELYFWQVGTFWQILQQKQSLS